MCVHMYVFVHVRVSICVYACSCVWRVYASMGGCVYLVCVCVCACVCMCVVSLFISGQLLKGGLGHSSLDDLHGSRKEDEVYMHICVCERHKKKLGRLVPKIYLAD